MKIETPCISICKLDSKSICIGCFRTTDEIARWREMTNCERVAIMRDLDRRRPKLRNIYEVKSYE